MNKDKYYLDIAKTVSTRSKCVSLQVGCVFVRDDNVISTGINGTPRGFINCCDKFKERCEEHHEWSLKYESHAEIAAIIQAESSVAGATAYCTHSPCFNCLKYMVRAGIVKMIFTEKYWRMSEEEYQEMVDYAVNTNVRLIHYSEGDCNG